jgi:serine protease Do
MSRPAGVLVNNVDAKSPAAAAGIKAGDVITAINGREVDDPEALRFRVATLPIGSKGTLSILRGGSPRQLAVPIVAPPEDPPRDSTALSGRQPLAGATVANLSPALAEEIGFTGPKQGVVVLEVARNSPASRVGVESGDVVLRIDEREVTSVRQLATMLSKTQQVWKVTVRRGDKVLTSTVAG